MKKKSELAFSTIIMAAIGLIVLALLAYMLISRTTLFKRNLGECEGRGGSCQKEPCSGDKPLLSSKGCYVGENYNESYNCCVGVG